MHVPSTAPLHLLRTRLRLPRPQRLIGGAAAISMALIIWLSSLIWPVGYLGFIAEFSTGEIASVDPISPAAQAGLQVGDTIVSIYGRPLAAVNNSWNRLIAIPPIGSTIAMRIERSGIHHQIVLTHAPPTLDFQITKISALILALICWLVGYLFGVVRRGAIAPALPIALLWFVLASVLGSYTFAAFASLPLLTLLEWALITLLIPCAISTHVWFPARMVSRATVQRVRRLLMGWLGSTHALLLLAVAVWRPTLVELQSYLSDVTLLMVPVGMLSGGIILWRVYRATPIAHLRRQARILMLAWLGTAIIWGIMVLVPLLIEQSLLLVDQHLNTLTIGVPLAYLTSGISRDLYRIDRLLRRLIIHLLTMLILVAVLATVSVGLGFQRTDVTFSVIAVFILLYPIITRGIRTIAARFGDRDDEYQPMAVAHAQLTTSLDSATVIAGIIQGVQTTFHDPAAAFYLGEIRGPGALSLISQVRMPHLPTSLAPASLTRQLAERRAMITSQQLAVLVQDTPLHDDETQALQAPEALHWCPIVHHSGALLGILVLGRRDDLDPYRSRDLHELQRLLDAAALALANCDAYRQQQQAKQQMRELYQHLQEAQAETAAAIARELHDEVINITVRENIAAIEKVLGWVQHPALREELQVLLESERATGEMLRLICAQLQPISIDEPLGLAAVVRMQVDRARSIWPGTCQLVVSGNACPVSIHIQLEVMRITREALMNAIKHANANQIQVELRYPADPEALIELRIVDDGQGAQRIAPRSGHWGLPYMQESARVIGGILELHSAPGQGTKVVVRFSGSGLASRSVGMASPV